MSVTIEHEFVVECRNCEFKQTCDSAGAAEGVAGDHLEEWTEQGLPNASHTVEISAVIVVQTYY